MRKIAWTVVFILIFTMYYLSSIPSLGVLPVFRQLNDLFRAYDTSVMNVAESIASRAPTELAPARSLLSDFYQYTMSNPAQVEFLLRKSAHVIMFFLITVALFFLLRQYFRSSFLTVGGAFVIATGLAFLDEYHQTHVPGRSGNLTDVAIDVAGITLAVMFIILALLITKRQRNVSRERTESRE